MSQSIQEREGGHGSSPAAWRDALIVVAIAVAAAVVCVELNVSEALVGWFKPYERQQLDELPPVLLVLATSLVWYSVRRYREARRQVKLRRVTENQLASALAENQRLAQQYVELQEYERKALARDLHDELGQFLNVMKLDAVSIRDAGSGEAALVGSASRALIDNVDRIYAVVSNLIRQLRPVGFDELGIAAAIEYCVNEWRARLPDVSIELCIVGDLRELVEIKRLAVYRLVQESLTNIARHAQATRVTISIGRAGRTEPVDPRAGVGAADGLDQVVVSIADNGKGLDLAAPRAGLGLVGMRERVAALGGHLHLTSRPDEGLEIAASIPFGTRLAAENPT